MNKEIFDQLPDGERSVAEKIISVSENMKVPQSFEWNLESDIMDIYQKKLQPRKGWFSKIVTPMAWAVIAVIGLFLLNWTLRSLVPADQLTPATPITKVPFETFENNVRQGNICEGSLALAHGFQVSLTNEDKTAFLPVDTEDTLGEARSFTWSTNGKRLAVVGNTTGSGAIYIMDLDNGVSGQFLSAAESGYLRDADWSSNGSQMVLWSSQNMTTLYILNSLGHGMIEEKMDVQIVGTPRFAPNGRHIVFYGANATSSGLFLVTQEDFKPRLLPFSKQGASSFAFSPDGSLIAYMEYERDKGEASLTTQNLTKGKYRLLGTLSIPNGSGASVPETVNLSWSQDGTKLVFEFGWNATDRAIYIAYADGSGLVKVIESAHAPTISSDGRCLAYIKNKQVFILDLSEITPTSNSAKPFPLVDLPSGKATDFRLDKLQWRP